MYYWNDTSPAILPGERRPVASDFQQRDHHGKVTGPARVAAGLTAPADVVRGRWGIRTETATRSRGSIATICTTSSRPSSSRMATGSSHSPRKSRGRMVRAELTKRLDRTSAKPSRSFSKIVAKMLSVAFPRTPFERQSSSSEATGASSPLRHQGCFLKQQGKQHELWSNQLTGHIEAVSRHQEIPNNLARKICRALSIPEPS